MSFKRPFRNPYSLQCFQRVEDVLNNEAGLAKYLNDYTFYRSTASNKKVRIARFTKSVVFELGCRSQCAIECSKIEILMAAVLVKQKWPKVPLIEPTLGRHGKKANGDLYNSLKISLGELEARRIEIEQNIESHKKALQSLLR